MPTATPVAERQCPLQDVLDEALGRAPEQHDDRTDRWGGPAGNARLTGWLGVTILVLALAQLVTLLDVSGWLDWHVVIGAALIPFALAKTATTGWRLTAYYRERPVYRAAGTPPTALRVLGPFVVVSTLALLGTGVALVALGQAGSNQRLFSIAGFGVSALTLHQAVFFAWAAFTGLHVLARLVPAWRRTAGARGELAGRGARGAVWLAVTALAATTSALLVASLGTWH